MRLCYIPRLALLLILLGAAAPPALHGQAFSDADWSDQYGLLGADGPIYTAIQGPDGHIYVGGDFTTISGRTLNGVGRWNTTAQQWEPLNLGLNGRAEDLAFLSDGTLVAVGNFSFRNTAGEGYRGAGVALWDGTVWSVPGGGTTARIPGGFASSVAADGTSFYVGGNFTQVTQPDGTTLATRAVARWDAAAGRWTALGDGSDAARNGVATNTGGGFVRDLLMDADGTLVVAGTFEQARLSDGTTRPLRGLARWHPATQTWSGFGEAGQDEHNGAKEVYQVVRSGPDYYVRFSNDRGVLYQSDGTMLNAKYVGKWNGSTGSWEVLGAPNPQPWSSMNGVDQAASLTLDASGRLVVVGATTAYDGTTQTATRGFARWTGTGWTPHFTAPTGIATYAPSLYQEGGTLLSAGGDLYVFGPFLALQDGTGTTDVLRTARYDGTQWHALGSGGHLGLTLAAGGAKTLAVAVHGNYVYVAGNIIQAGSLPVDGFARLDRTTGTWSAPGTLGVHSVATMQVWGDRLVIGGRFGGGTSPEGTVYSPGLIAWNTQTEAWEAFGDGTQGRYANTSGLYGTSAGVTDLDVLPNGDLVIVGSFTQVNRPDGTQLDVQNIVLWDAARSQWKLLAEGQPGQPVGINKDVLAVAADAAGALYVAGKASEARQPDGTQINTNRIVRWDGTRWHNLGVGVTQASGSDIYDVAVVGSEVFVGGTFSRIENTDGGLLVRGLARWDGARWHGFGSLPSDATVAQLFPLGGSLFVGGNLGSSLGAIAYCTSTCSPMGSGLGGYDGLVPITPQAMDMQGGSLFVAGGFQEAGGQPSLRLAEFTAVPVPARLAAPLLLTPRPGTRGVALSSTFAWSPIYGATSYDLQVAVDAAFTQLVADQGGRTAPAATVSGLDAATTYYVRVRARNGGTTSDWSTPASFFTLADQLPPAPLLTAPADGATNQPPAPTLRWDAAAQAFTYTVQVATDAAFGTVVHEATDVAGLAHTVSPSLALRTTHYWRVRAHNNLGDGPWSAPRHFGTAEADLAAPLLVYPNDGQENQRTDFSAQFDGVAGAASYLLQLAEDPAFTVNVTDVPYAGSGTGRKYVSLYDAGLTSGTRYYWRVQGLDGSGQRGPWSLVFTFRTSGVHPDAPPTPSLKAPAHYANYIPVLPTLEWYASEGATTYDVQVSTSSYSFTGDDLVLDTTGVAGTALTAEGLDLNTGTYYYWRVRATNRYASSWSSTWRFRTTFTVIARPTLTTPADGADEQPVQPTLAWAAVANASYYLVQVSDTPDFSHLVAESSPSGTTYTLGTFLEGGGTTYYWRVQARQSTSAYSPWSTAWSFTTTTAPPPPAPVLLSPADGGAIRYKYNTGAPYVTWMPVAEATQYQIQLSTSDAFLEGSTFTQYTGATGWGGGAAPAWVDDLVLAAHPNVTHVRVRAVGTGGGGAWSTPHVFSVQNVADAMPFYSWDGVPVHGMRGVGTSGTFTWHPAGHAQTEIEVATDAAFTDVVVSATSTAGSTAYSGLARDTGYFFRLRPVGGAWSSTFYFETTDGTPDAAPTLVTPADAARGVDSRPAFTWRLIPDAVTYQVQVSTEATFAAPVVDEQVTGEAFTPAVRLAYQTPHHWRVRAVGDVGAGPWSEAATFTTRTPPPPAPTLLAPADGAEGVAISTPLTWSRPHGARSYSYEVATDAHFQDVARSGAVTTAGVVLTGLTTGTQYYVRLQAAYDERVTSEWSPTYHFTTVHYDAPPPPAATAPADGAAGLSVPVTVHWEAVAEASHYQVQMSYNAAFEDGGAKTTMAPLLDATTQETSYTYYWAYPNQTYYWRVRAVAGPHGSDAASAWSETRVLSTGPGTAPTVAPTPTYPAEGATDVSRMVTFAWETLPEGTAYCQVQYSTDPAFSTNTYWAYGTPGATTATVSTALDGTTWYWRVRAYSTSGMGPWSAASAFSLAAAYPPTDYATITRPAYGAVAPQQPLLTWRGIAYATSYDVEVDDDDRFQTPVLTTTVSGLQHVPAGLAPGTVYHARVRGRSDAGVGPWFHTQFATRTAPSAEAPVTRGDPPPVTLPDVGGLEVDFFTLGSDATLGAVFYTTPPPGGFDPESAELTTPQYWTLDLDGSTSFTADVCFPLAAVAGPVTDYSQLTVYRRSAEGDAWRALSTVLRPRTDPAWLCATGVSTFSDFAVAAPPAALPVELAAFEALAEGDVIHLHWQTASETDNAGFEVQRQADDGAWVAAGWVDGAGTTVEAAAYTFTDAAVPYDARTLRYRLRQVDFDGAFQHSPVLEVSANVPDAFRLEPNFPNPFNASTVLRYALPEPVRVRLLLYDVTGRRVAVLVDRTQDAGRYEVRFDAHDLASGVYFYHLQAGGHHQSRRMLLVK